MSEKTQQPYGSDNQQRHDNPPGSLEHPPGSGDRDEEAHEKSKEQLERVAGG